MLNWIIIQKYSFLLHLPEKINFASELILINGILVSMLCPGVGNGVQDLACFFVFAIITIACVDELSDHRERCEVWS